MVILFHGKVKKQSVVSRSSAESEYRALASVTTEVMWTIKLLNELKVNHMLPVEIFCDNKAAIQIANNPVFHDKTKHFEVDLYFLREKITS